MTFAASNHKRVAQQIKIKK